MILVITQQFKPKQFVQKARLTTAGSDSLAQRQCRLHKDRERKRCRSTLSTFSYGPAWMIHLKFFHFESRDTFQTRRDQDRHKVCGIADKQGVFLHSLSCETGKVLFPPFRQTSDKGHLLAKTMGTTYETEIGAFEAGKLKKWCFSKVISCYLGLFLMGMYFKETKKD